MKARPRSYLYLGRAAFPESRQRLILVSGSRFSCKSGRLRSDSAAASSMTWLTSIPGLMTISPEGGP